MPIPREAVRLVGDSENPRLLTGHTGIDQTEIMQNWMKIRSDQLEEEEPCGFIFKTKSPSSAMRDINIYNDNGVPVSKGAGMFAKAFMRRFPLVPAEDEGRLNDPGLRENFIERVFVYNRWQNFLKNDGSIAGLVSFHTCHKLLIMTHSPQALQQLGSLVATAKSKSPQKLFAEYISILLPSLKLRATVSKNVNVLRHVLSYFKKFLTANENKNYCR